MNKKQYGFSLIELMIVVIIIGILGSIAYPSYLDHVRRGNRTDAQAALSDAAQQMERCRSATGTFAGCGPVTRGAYDSPEGFYEINVAATGGVGFTATATAQKSPQTGDSGCTTLTLDHVGKRTPTSGDCW